MLSKSSILFVIIICLSSNCYGANTVGVILNGYQDNCWVYSSDIKYSCKDVRLLNPSDVVEKFPNIEQVQIKWAPYAKPKQTSSKSLIVNYDPPKNHNETLKHILDFIGFVSAEHNVVYTSTRSNPIYSYISYPNNNATVLNNQPITFKWIGKNNTKFIIENSNGEIVYVRQISSSANTTDISPIEISMKTNETYYWYLNSQLPLKKRSFKLADDITNSQINEVINSIGKSNMSQLDKTINISSYYYFLSRAHSNDSNLLWMSFKAFTDNYDYLKQLPVFNNIYSDYLSTISEDIEFY